MSISEQRSPVQMVTMIATGLILIGILAGFAILFGIAIILTLQATNEVPAQINDPFNTVANTLMGAVIAILASSKLVEQQNVNNDLSKTSLLTDIARGMQINKPSLTVRDWRAIISLIYFIVYFVLGICAIGAWLTKTTITVDDKVINLVPGLVQTYATVFIGSVVPVGIRFFANE